MEEKINRGEDDENGANDTGGKTERKSLYRKGYGGIWENIHVRDAEVDSFEVARAKFLLHLPCGILRKPAVPSHAFVRRNSPQGT